MNAIDYLLKSGQERAAQPLLQQSDSFGTLLIMVGSRPQEARSPVWDVLFQQAIRLANGLPNTQQQAALQQLAEAALRVGRLDQVPALRKRFKDPGMAADLDRRIQSTVQQGIRPNQEASLLELLKALPDSPTQRDLWLEVINQYARQGRSLTALPSTRQAAVWIKNDYGTLAQVLDAYRRLQAFQPALEILDAVQSNFRPLDIVGLRLELLIEAGDQAAALKLLPTLRQQAEESLKRPQSRPGNPILNQLGILVYLAPYYAEAGDRTQAMTLLTQASQLLQQPDVRKSSRDEQNRAVAQTVMAYTRTAHAAAIAGDRAMAQQAIAQGQPLLQLLQPYRPDVTAAQTLTCVRSVYNLQ
jgi:hypothetical protein